MASAKGGDGGGEFDLSRADQGVWLMKVPHFVSDRWKEMVDKPTAAAGAAGAGAAAAGAGAGAIVGRIRMAFDPLNATGEGGQASTQFTMRLELPAAADSSSAAAIPGEYRLAFAPDHVPMHVFSESSHGRVALEGRVEHKFDMQPPSCDEGYRRMLQTRERKWNTPKRTIKMMDSSRPSRSNLPMPGTVANTKRKPPSSTLPAFASGSRGVGVGGASAADNKRVRGSRETVEGRLFVLFEERPFWTLRQLVDATQQPQQFLKEVLGDICVYNKRGPNQGLYELKPEYKHTS